MSDIIRKESKVTKYYPIINNVRLVYFILTSNDVSIFIFVVYEICTTMDFGVIVAFLEFLSYLKATLKKL